MEYIGDVPRLVQVGRFWLQARPGLPDAYQYNYSHLSLVFQDYSKDTIILTRAMTRAFLDQPRAAFPTGNGRLMISSYSMAMRYSIVSDIHGNLEAFEAVLHDPAFSAADRIVCLGDIVGYGANPQECIDLLHDHDVICIAGNHDWAAAKQLDTAMFNAPARHALTWTADHLDAEHQRFLANLPLTWEEEFFMISHASPGTPDQWNYIVTRFDALWNFSTFRQPLCFVGHTHIPMIFTLNETGDVDERRLPRTVSLQGRSKWIINVGSVGQPRDHNPAAAYGILDTKNKVFRLRRVTYDVKRAQIKILAAGLPLILAERIESGW